MRRSAITNIGYFSTPVARAYFGRVAQQQQNAWESSLKRWKERISTMRSRVPCCSSRCRRQQYVESRHQKLAKGLVGQDETSTPTCTIRSHPWCAHTPMAIFKHCLCTDGQMISCSSDWHASLHTCCLMSALFPKDNKELAQRCLLLLLPKSACLWWMTPVLAIKASLHNLLSIRHTLVILQALDNLPVIAVPGRQKTGRWLDHRWFESPGYDWSELVMINWYLLF